MLYMRIAAGLDRGAHAATDDFTARARIRDAAIECFAAQGFKASVRTIAAKADVSPGLLTHHFGSKEALRAECDTEILRRYRDLKNASIRQPATQLMGFLADAGQHGTVMIYLLRSLQTGGSAGREFLDHVIDDARDYMREAVAMGVVKPSRDEEARLRYLAYSTLGALLLEFMMGKFDGIDFAEAVRRRGATDTLPTLELFTEGLLTSPDMLNAYLEYTQDGSPLEDFPASKGSPERKDFPASPGSSARAASE